MGTPIIPLGTSAILGLGAIEKRPKVVAGPDGEDTIAIRTCAYFSLSFDHRIVDGADADKFLAVVKKGLEGLPRRRAADRCPVPSPSNARSSRRPNARSSPSD